MRGTVYLVDAAARHAVVVRLKGGDPMLFGRAKEEIAALEAAGVAFDIVPGITAALAASAELGISLTQGVVARSVTFVTPRIGVGQAESGWAESIVNADTGAIYMGMGEATAISAELQSLGMPATTPAAVVENASLPTARTWFTTLSALPDLATQCVEGPALILLGEAYRARATARLSSRSIEDAGRCRMLAEATF